MKLGALLTSKKFLLWAAFGVVALVIIGAAYLISPWSPFQESTKPSDGSRESSEEGCNSLNTSNWQTYDQQGFSVKYPQDWAYKEEQPAPDSPQWMVSFGPKSGSSVVWIGSTAADFSQFKTEITSTWVPGFDIDKQEPAIIDGKQGNKLTVAGHAASYKSYIYHIPVQNNIAYMFQGPAIESDSQFEKCEPQIFQKMLETFKFPQVPGGGGSDDQTYTNDEVDISFDYPSDWEIKMEYYYETAAGEKATVPTIILGRKSDPVNVDTNQIIVNGRQTFCAESGSKSQESVGGIKITFYSYPGLGSNCVEANVPGKDRNGKNLDYSFVSRYTDQAVKDVFKKVVKSFKTST